MKQLALLMFAILILGCGTETPVVEDTVVEEPVVEEPEPIIEEPPPVVMEDEPIIPPRIVEGSVSNGDVDVDPEPLNRDGIVFRFTEPLNMFMVDLLLEGESLQWLPRDVTEKENIGNLAKIWRGPGSQLLEYDTEYNIEIYAQGHACNGAETGIRFRTKPR